MKKSSILTNQLVVIHQTPASVGDRLVARLIDAVAMSSYSVLVVSLAGAIDWPYDREIIGFVVLFLPVILYDVLFETCFNGQTPGKNIMKIRVVMANGTAPGLGAFLLRWTTALIEVWAMGGVGLLAILFSPRSQRLGDLAAGTMVIKEGSYRRAGVSLDEYSYLDSNYRPHYPQAEDLSMKQADIIEKTLDNFVEDRDERIERLAAKVARVIGVTTLPPNRERFLYQVLRDFKHYSFAV